MKTVLTKEDIIRVLDSAITSGYRLYINEEEYTLDKDNECLECSTVSEGSITYFLNDIIEAEIKDEFKLLFRIPTSSNGDMTYYTANTLTIMQPINIWDIL